MQFQVNGKDYFLAFVEDEGRWYVFAPSASAIERIPVYVDGPVAEKLRALQNGQGKVSN
jgi:hypothetical protein